jgi:hypothetical protein
MLQAKERAPTPSPSIAFTFGLVVSPSRSLGVRVATLTLGSRPKQGLIRLGAKKEARESHLVLPGVQKNVKKWTFTLPSELPLWELESQMESRIFK